MKNMKYKRYIVIDNGDIIDLKTYGLYSWGDDVQYHIDIKGDKVYIKSWEYGGEWEDDIIDSTYIGKIVYMSDKPLYIRESPRTYYDKKIEYQEYGIDVDKLFQLDNR